MNTIKFHKTAVCSAVVAIALAGCGSDSSPVDGPAIFSLGLSDAPIEEASKVMVCFTGIELVGNEGDPVNLEVGAEGVVPANDECIDDIGNVIPDTHGVDLLTLQGASSAEFISGVELAPGVYGQLRLRAGETLELLVEVQE